MECRPPSCCRPVAALLAALVLGLPAPAAEFEQPAEVRASEVLPPELLEGPHHRVEDAVGSDGLQRSFRVTSPFGDFEAHGEDELRERIQEIEAIAELRAAGRGEPSGGGANGRPPPMIGGVLVGDVLGEGAGEKREPVVADLDTMKRLVAHRLGIDPHTRNPELQKELRQHAWAAFAGGMSSPLMPEESEPPEVAEDAEPSERASELLRDYSADDLEALNRLELTAMGVDEALREEFLENPAYTPGDGTRLVDALSGLEGTADRDAFLDRAAKAGSSEEARSYQRMAELMRGYHQQVGSLERFVTVGGRVAARAEDGTVVVPMTADHALWTPGVAAFAESVARAAGEDPELAKTRVLVSGSVSERTREEMRRRGIDVTEGARGLGDAPPESDGAR